VASLSELALRGAKYPGKCRFPEATESIILTEAIEIIPCTPEAQKMIQECPASYWCDEAIHPTFEPINKE